jgi:hypothetical protein
VVLPMGACRRYPPPPCFSKVLTDTFSAKPRKVVFRVYMPKSQMAEFQNQSKMRLKVFGDTLHPLSTDGYVEIRPIAVY